MSSSDKKFPIVGIGASAGGIPALESFFKGMTTSCGAAFVIVTHLSPDRESLLHEVIGRYTEMPVKVAEDSTRVEPDNVYVLPQNAILSIDKGRLQVRRPNAVHRERKPIDIFFSALAKDQGEYAVGVILSGGDSDGTLGVKAIKERGGLTLAQASDGSGPRNPDMPASAIGSGLIDLAVPAEAMAEKLVEFASSIAKLDGLARTENRNEKAQLRKAQESIAEILRGQTGHDFSGYKAKTFLRRVHRRMQAAQIETVDAYIRLLREDAQEVRYLFRDLLINVTNFFRDANAFDALAKQVVPRLFENRDANDTIRLWVPGCATGEEVYSLAILLREHIETLSVMPRVQIFATDIDEPALAVARAGRYPEALMEGVSTKRRERFFHTDGSSYVLTKEVREMCIFSPHSVLRDPPFSRMDLVSCRNLLIYFGPEMQSRVVPTFHYALRPGGYLLLGTSEGISRHSELFATVDKKHRIFQSREDVSAPVRPPIDLPGGRSVPFAGRRNGQKAGSAELPLRQTIEAQVMARFAPPHVVVNGEGDVVHYSARTGRYLEQAQGAPTRQLLTMARKGLRLDLRGALREAVETRQTVMRDNLTLEEDDDRVQTVALTVEPLADRPEGEPLFLVLFDALGRPQKRAEAGVSHGRHSDGTVEQLESELRDTREQLQSTIEEYETALEELKSSNEELVSVNEEAQSSNEELEASKEEMQSLNEELNTINAELNGKVEELDRANSDLRNLFESTQIATVFLDRDLVIRNYTPAASSFFSLLPADIGRPLTDLSSHLDYPDLKDHISQVFQSGEMLEHRMARNGDGEHYLVRLNPYWSAEERILGVVVSFVDITTLTEAEEHQKTLIHELNHRVKNMMATVQAVAAQTLNDAASVTDARQAFGERLRAMARSHDLLTKENWAGADLEALIQRAVEPYQGDEGHFSIEGPALRLAPNRAMSIAMALHELVTNAVKYGALSVPEGQVDISWRLEGDGGERRLIFRWAEKNGPPVEPPSRKGFGSRLIERSLAAELHADVNVEYQLSGVMCTIDAPMPNGQEGANPLGDQRQG